MDGFELCQQLSRSRPEMLKIILTCHAELPMIQRAIEGNISGYIIKSDFDMEKIAKLFARVRQNVLRSRSQKAHDLLILGGAAADIHSMQGQGAAMIRLAERVILAHTTIPTSEWIQGIPDSIVVSLTGEQARQAQADQRALEEVLQRYAAYEMTPGMRLYTFAPRPALDRGQESALLDQVLQGEWLLSSREKNELTVRIEKLYIPASHVRDKLALLWQGIDCILPGSEARDASVKGVGICPWYEIKAQMARLQALFTEHVRRLSFSQDSAGVILHAVAVLRTPRVLFGKAEDVAAMVGFSRSHFSRCFSQFMGMSCKRYMQIMRQRYVREKTQREGMSLSEVAQALGYINEEYFLKLYFSENK